VTPDDPRHGTESGYRKHYRDGEKPCDDCRRAGSAATREREQRLDLAEIPLTDGEWVPRGPIQVWVPRPPVFDPRAKCGTPGGYYSHLRHTKTTPCEPCKAAHAEANGRYVA